MGRTRIVLVLSLALVFCLVLFGLWATLSDDAVSTPALAESVAPIDGLPRQAQPPAVTHAGRDVAPSALPDGSSSAFGTLRGRVVDAVTRKPVREFDVEFHGTRVGKAGEEAPGKRTFQASDGRFQWEYLLPGSWTVTASARGYQRFELVGLQIRRGAATPEIVLPLRAGHRLSGRIYDEASGAGIPSASIGFREFGTERYEGNFRMRVRVSSAKDGSFVLEGAPPGRITLEIDAETHAGRELDVAVSEDTPPLEIALSAGGMIAGQLTAADGVTPIAGAAGLFNLDEQSGFTGRTGAAGEFSYQHLAPGRYKVHGQAQGGSASQEVVLAKNQRIAGLVLALSAGRSIRGSVTGLRPEDLKRTSISLRREDNAGNPYADVRVDDRGAYALQGVAPGRVEVVADVSMRRQLVKTVEVPADSDLTVNLDFPAGARLSGHVTRAGKPLPGVDIRARPVVEQPVFIYGVSTSQDGEYVIEGLSTGEYHVFAGRYKSRLIKISGDMVFDIDVPLAQLSGRVLEEGGKAPIVGAEVSAWPAEPGSSHNRVQASSDHFGQFALVGLEPGDYLLTAYKPGFEMFREPLAYALPVGDMAIRLGQDKGVEIRVRDASSGKALPWVYAIEMIGAGDGSRLILHLDEKGLGYIPGALAGSTLSFAAEGYASAVIRAWSGQRLDLQLERQVAQ